MQVGILSISISPPEEFFSFILMPSTIIDWKYIWQASLQEQGRCQASNKMYAWLNKHNIPFYQNTNTSFFPTMGSKVDASAVQLLVYRNDVSPQDWFLLSWMHPQVEDRCYFLSSIIQDIFFCWLNSQSHHICQYLLCLSSVLFLTYILLLDSLNNQSWITF